MRVEIIKRWKHSPEVQLSGTTEEGHSIGMDLYPFIQAVKEEIMATVSADVAKEIGSVAMVFKQDTFNARLDAAIQAVLPKVVDAAVDRVVREMRIFAVHNFSRNT